MCLSSFFVQFSTIYFFDKETIETVFSKTFRSANLSIDVSFLKYGVFSPKGKLLKCLYHVDRIIFQSVILRRNCFIFDKAYSNFSSTQTDLLNYLSCFLARAKLKDSYLLKWRYTRFKPYGSIRHYSPAFVDFQ